MATTAVEAVDETRSGIYVIRNRVNHKEYVGSAVCIRKRIKEHLKLLRARKHHSMKLQNAWNKYGEAAFAFDVLAIVDDKSTLLRREQEWLDALCAAEHGYNMLPTAGSMLGFIPSAESRMKMSIAGKGKPKSAEHRAAASLAHGLRGKPMSEERRAAVSRGKRGKPWSPAAHIAHAIANARKKQQLAA